MVGGCKVMIPVRDQRFRLSWCSSWVPKKDVNAADGRHWLFCMLICLILLSGLCLAQPANSSSEMNGTPGPAKIHAGIYVLSIGKLDEVAGAFDIDFYLDLKSDQTCDLDGFEFMNGRATSKELTIDRPGEKFYRIQASLYSPMNFRDYPFDENVLSIEIEDKRNGDDDVVYIFDANNSGIDHQIALMGWQLDGFEGTVMPHSYSAYNQTFSRLTFGINIIRPGISSVIKSLLPILFIIFVTLLTVFIKESMIETRLKLNISILIAAVLFHVSIGNSLPPIAYLTLVDKLMILTYLILVAALFNDILIMRRTEV